MHVDKHWYVYVTWKHDLYNFVRQTFFLHQHFLTAHLYAKVCARSCLLRVKRWVIKFGSSSIGVVSATEIAKTLRSSGNQYDGSRSGIEGKRKPSDPSDSDSVELPIATPIFYFHWNVRILTLPTPPKSFLADNEGCESFSNRRRHIESAWKQGRGTDLKFGD